MAHYNVIKKADLPEHPRRHTNEYADLLDTFEELNPEQAIMLETEDKHEADRIRSTIYHYFGKGSYSMKTIGKLKYVIVKK